MAFTLSGSDNWNIGCRHLSASEAYSKWRYIIGVLLLLLLLLLSDITSIDSRPVFRRRLKNY